MSTFFYVDTILTSFPLTFQTLLNEFSCCALPADLDDWERMADIREAKID